MNGKIINLSVFDKDENSSSSNNISESTEIEKPKRKRGRPKKNDSDIILTSSYVPQTKQSDVPLCQSSEPYENSYVETNDMLKVSIMQIDSLANDVKEEINTIKASRSIKGKYKYMSDLCSTASSLVGTKLAAIKEMNSVISKCHELEIRRIKDIKSAQANQQDDDKYIADLYNAYINTPVGNGPSSPFMMNTSANTTNNIPVLMQGQAIQAQGSNEEQNFQNYLNNMTPEQNRMLLGDNPNIETVVVYDPNTGDKFFDVIDTSTGCGVNNYPRPDKILLDDTTIDFQSGIATNTNLGQSWKVVMSANGDPLLNQF